jgi:hypothetical protein
MCGLLQAVCGLFNMNGRLMASSDRVQGWCLIRVTSTVMNTAKHLKR